MISLFFDLFGWMPGILQVLVFGVVAIFVLWSVLKLVALVLDIIPFI